MAPVDLLQLQNNLNKVNYPLSKKDLLKYAEEKGVDEGVLRALKRLPSKQYQTLTDVFKSVNETFTKTINTPQLEKNLNDITYPLSKKDLLKYAEEKGVDEGVLRALKQLPSKEYQTLADVTEAIRQSE